MLSLFNFADQLDPDVLDRAQQLQQSGQISRLKDEGEQVWSARFKAGMEASVSLGKNGRIEGAVCSCGQLDEVEWEEQPCVHVAATYFALREKITEDKKSSKKTGKARSKAEKPVAIKPAPVPKDPAEALLRDLEPAEVVEFVRQQLAKNKDLKSQFLLHFSEKSTHAGQFNEIVTNAIAAVRGRRKYLSAGDGSKIATALTPLYKQAAAAEARGLFREAFAACGSLLRHLPDVFGRLENPSARLNTLYENTCELLGVIAENNQAPFELRGEITDTLLELYQQQQAGLPDDVHIQLYNLVRRAARANGQVNELAGRLQFEALSIPAGVRRETWSPAYYRELALLRRLYQLYDEDMHDEKAAINLLERHKDYAELYRLLIRKRIEGGDYKGALAGIEDMQKNTRRYDSWGMLHQLNGLLVEVYSKSGDRQKLQQLAARLFKESGYVNFDYYEMEKAAWDANDWPGRVDALLKEVGKMPVLFGAAAHPTFEILTREKRWSELRDALLRHTNQMGLWARYGLHIAALYPDDFLQGATKAIDTALGQANTMLYGQVAQLLKTIRQLDGGTETAQGMLNDIRQRYGNRPALMSALNQL